MPPLVSSCSVASHFWRQGYRLSADPEYAPAYAPFEDQFPNYKFCQIGGHRKTKPLGRKNNGGIYTDHISVRIDEGAAAVAGIEGRIGLNDIVDEPSALAAQRTPQRAHHARGDGILKTEWIADSNGDLPDLQAVAGSERNGRQVVAVHFHHGEVRSRVVAHHAGLKELRPSCNMPSIRSAPFTTWLLVTTKPSELIINPLPVPPPGWGACRRFCWGFCLSNVPRHCLPGRRR